MRQVLTAAFGHANEISSHYTSSTNKDNLIWFVVFSSLQNGLSCTYKVQVQSVLLGINITVFPVLQTIPMS